MTTPKTKAGSPRPRGKEKIRILTEILQRHPDWGLVEVAKQFHEVFPGVRIHPVDFAAARKAAGLAGSPRPAGKNWRDATATELKGVLDALQQDPQLAHYISVVVGLAESVGGITRLQYILQVLHDLGSI